MHLRSVSALRKSYSRHRKLPGLGWEGRRSGCPCLFSATALPELSLLATNTPQAVWSYLPSEPPDCPCTAALRSALGSLWPCWLCPPGQITQFSSPPSSPPPPLVKPEDESGLHQGPLSIYHAHGPFSFWRTLAVTCPDSFAW